MQKAYAVNVYYKAKVTVHVSSDSEDAAIDAAIARVESEHPEYMDVLWVDAKEKGE